jgi:release factor glutamine methyltransferase
LTWSELLAAAERELPAPEARRIVEQASGFDGAELLLHLDETAPERACHRGLHMVERRMAGEPLQYALGAWGFRRLDLLVDHRVLIPRPETEVVVERALALLAAIEAPRVLDIGVGSGAIALALKDECPAAHVVGVDVSPDALSLARENAELLGLEIELREGDVGDATAGWDLVVSNPPYVDTLEGLQPELRHEPERALLGVGFHESIARTARTRFLVLEVGDGQARQVADKLAAAGYRDVTITPDLAGIDRVVEGRR